MKKALSTFCAMLLLLTIGCQAQPSALAQEATALSSDRTVELYVLSKQFAEYLNEKNTDAAMAMMDEAMTDAMDGKLESTWTQLGDSLGTFIRADNYIGITSGNYEALELTLVFEKGNIVQRVVFDSDNRISGLRFRNGEVEQAVTQELPEGITETDVTVDAGDGYPLAGKLTLPENGDPIAAVVLIHGSGPSDMNETIGANAPFRDFAFGLAKNGIAVLRYDKRTYSHHATLTGNEAIITIDEEVSKDAIAAVKLLKSRNDINADRIYLLGHSMGGGLLSYINSLGANCAGYIVMAGSIRNLWELSVEQNLLIADELEHGGNKNQAEQIRQFVQAERLRAEGLDVLGGADTVFGMPVSYLQTLEKIGAISLHMDDELPILVLQGEKDRQVTMADFMLWQNKLSAHHATTFISYPALNHLFGEYVGEPVPFSQMVTLEYGQNTPVADEVMDDISDWIKNNK